MHTYVPAPLGCKLDGSMLEACCVLLCSSHPAVPHWSHVSVVMRVHVVACVAAKAKDVLLLPSPERAAFLAGCTRPIDRCNAIVGVEDNGDVMFCDKDIKACSYRRFHVCTTHGKEPAILMDHVQGQGDGTLARWCRTCAAPAPLGRFDALSPVCDRHVEDGRSCEGRRPVAPATQHQDANALGTEWPRLTTICVDDAGVVNLMRQEKCDVTTCGRDVETPFGVCEEHSKVR